MKTTIRILLVLLCSSLLMADIDPTFFILGAQDEYLGWKVRLDNDLLYPTFKKETAKRRVYKYFLTETARSHQVKSDIKTVTGPNGYLGYKSNSIKKILLQFYPDLKPDSARRVDPVTGKKIIYHIGHIQKDVFDGRTLAEKLSYLAGIHLIWGKNMSFRLANTNKAKVVEWLLNDVGCKNIRMKSSEGGEIPGGHIIIFTPTETLGKMLETVDLMVEDFKDQ